MSIKQSLEIKQARIYINSPSYRRDRLDKLAKELEHWEALANDARIFCKRDCCNQIAEMYKKRMKWYLR